MSSASWAATKAAAVNPLDRVAPAASRFPPFDPACELELRCGNTQRHAFEQRALPGLAVKPALGAYICQAHALGQRVPTDVDMTRDSAPGPPLGQVQAVDFGRAGSREGAGPLLRARGRKAADACFQLPAGEAGARLRAHTGGGPAAYGGAPGDGGRWPGARTGRAPGARAGPGAPCLLSRQADVERIIPLAHVLLMPSDLESFGLAALEAMACGLPPEVTRVGGVPELITDGVGGYLEAVGEIPRKPRAWWDCSPTTNCTAVCRGRPAAPPPTASARTASSRCTNGITRRGVRPPSWQNNYRLSR
jgi:hypothetical protein